MSEMYKAYYSGTGVSEQLFNRILIILANEIGVEPERLRPTDDLHRDFSLPGDDAFELADEDFKMLLAELRVGGRDVPEFGTIHDVIVWSDQVHKKEERIDAAEERSDEP